MIQEERPLAVDLHIRLREAQVDRADKAAFLLRRLRVVAPHQAGVPDDPELCRLWCDADEVKDGEVLLDGTPEGFLIPRLPWKRGRVPEARRRAAFDVDDGLDIPGFPGLQVAVLHGFEIV
jgi:hypothetical protein